jgi:putative hydrolase of the HAD superfamily
VTDPATVLVLDLGGVVARWLPARRLDALARISGLPAPAIDALVFESGFDDAGERGAFGAEEFRVQLATLLGLAADTDTEAALRAAWAEAYEPVDAVLRVVRRHHGPTALLTNNGPLLEEALVHELSTIGEAFDHLLISWRLGATKPDPEAFERAATQLGAEPADILFADDSEANATAARRSGWRAIHFTTTLDLQAALAVR